ncbi:MICOS complex subunit Mic10-like [Sitophilus oryzae]|uniref:MICOS complex subunit MIC10 n=1 Tax=Sitophilus oryzae TaxID=7048 RepID=A0A6J2Y4Y1_SITOR|nr:MICOS complex subunit Mic10-like [Sitophilus oryzae]
MSSPIYIEEELGRKWDKCLSDSVIKFGGGIVLGSVFSLLFFKRKRWPILMGGGFGIGMAYANCEKDLNATIRSCELVSSNFQKK